MQKIAILALAIAPLAICAQAHALPTTVTVTWTAATYPSGTPVCSSSVMTQCEQGYQEVITPPSGIAVTIPACAPGSTTTPSAPCLGPIATSYVYAPGGTLPTGTYTVTVFAVAAGSTSGSTINSNTLTGTGVYLTPVMAGTLSIVIQ